MNEIQINYLIGLVLRKIDTFNFDSLKDVNINNNDYAKHIEAFVEEYAADTVLVDRLINFVRDNDEVNFEFDTLQAEKIGLYLTITFNGVFFTISVALFEDLLIVADCYLKKYLPLGSVVKLNKEKLGIESEKDSIVVIEQRMVHMRGKPYYLDYRGIPYPMGIFNEQMYLYFSTEDILEIIYWGYNDLENEGYELALKENLISNDVYSYSHYKENK